MSRSSIAALIQALNTVFPENGNLVHGSPYHSLSRAGGKNKQKTINITGSGAQTINLFKISGILEIQWIGLRVTNVTDSTTFSGVKFEIDDGTAQVDLTSTVDASGVVQNGFLYKELGSGSALSFVNPTAATIDEPASDKKLTQPVLVFQKTGDVDTYIRISFTGDANTDIDGCVEIYYNAICNDGELEVV